MSYLVTDGLGGQSILTDGLGPDGSRWGSGELIKNSPAFLTALCNAGTPYGGFGQLVKQNSIIKSKTYPVRVIFLSVGDAYPNNLYTGSPYVRIQGETAYFNEPMTGNIGAGDEMHYSGGKRCFLRRRISYSEWIVSDKNGGLPEEALEYVPVEALGRCFKTIDAAVGSTGGVPYYNGIADSRFLGTTDLIGVNSKVFLFCYRDNNAIDATPIKICGFDTDFNNEIHILTPGIITQPAIESQGENYFSNSPQHSVTGIPGEGYILNITGGTAAMEIKDVLVGVIGLEVGGTSENGFLIIGALKYGPLYDLFVKNCIINNTGKYGIHFDYAGIPVPPAQKLVLDEVSVWANIIYGQSKANIFVEEGVKKVNIYQNTLDKGSPTSRVVGIMIGDGTTPGDVGQVNEGYNIFIGGRPGYDIVDMGRVGVIT